MHDCSHMSAMELTKVSSSCNVMNFKIIQGQWEQQRSASGVNGALDWKNSPVEWLHVQL